MSPLKIEESQEYKKMDKRIQLLNLLKEYYGCGGNTLDFDSGDVPLREIISFMTEEGYPRRLVDAEITFRKIDKEIIELEEKKKQWRLKEIKDRHLNSLLIIPSWTKLIGTQMKGLYLGKQVVDLRRDTIIMLTDETQTFKEITKDRIAVIFGPGIFHSEFAVEPGKYIEQTLEINGVCISLDILNKIYTSERIYKSDTIDAVMTEVSTLVPFHIIEQSGTVQTYVRGILSRNVFHPNRIAIERFNQHIQDIRSYTKEEGFKILSAHPLWFNKLLVTNENIPLTGSGKKTISTPGVASVQAAVDKILHSVFPSEKDEMEKLQVIQKLKKEYNEMGIKILKEWIQT